MNFVISSKYFGVSFYEKEHLMPGCPENMGFPQEDLLDKEIFSLIPEGAPTPRPAPSPDVEIGFSVRVLNYNIYVKNAKELPLGQAPEGTIEPKFSWNKEVGITWHTSWATLEDAQKAFRDWLYLDEMQMDRGLIHHGKGKYLEQEVVPKGYQHFRIVSWNEDYELILAIPKKWGMIYPPKITISRNKEMTEYPAQIIVPDGTLQLDISTKQWDYFLENLIRGDSEITLVAVATKVVDNPILRRMNQS